jgi:hypothetical protein
MVPGACLTGRDQTHKKYKPHRGYNSDLRWVFGIIGFDPRSLCHAERYKAAMVAAGRWRPTRPEAQGHAGFRLNALVSLSTNASWAKLAAESIEAKVDPAELHTFINTILAVDGG